MTQRLLDLAEGVVQTTDATVTTVILYALPDNCVCRFTVTLVGRRGSNGDSGGYDARATFKRHAGGAATQVGATTAGAVHEDDATWPGLTIDANGNNVRVRTQGLAAVTIDWEAKAEILLYQP